MEQMDWAALFEQSISVQDFPIHIGERLHYLIKEVEVWDKSDARDEYVLLKDAHITECGWMRCVFISDDGHEWSALYNLKSPHQTHMYFMDA